jgi:hypothetical protein
VKHTLTLSRLAIGICGAVVGSYCAFTAFRNGQTLASGVDGIAFGSAFAAVVIGSWFLLPLASQSPKGRAVLMRIGWALCLAFVLVNAIGFTATHRTTQVGDRNNAITSYDTALAGLAQAQERLSAMKHNARWQSTSGCTDVTVPQSVAFCDDLRATQAKADQFSATVSAGKPATADAQADTIAWMLRADAGVVSKAMPVFMAVVLDVAASLFIWVALTTYSTAVAPVVTTIAPAKAAKRSATRKTKKPARKDWTKAEAYTTKEPVFAKPDRRRKTMKPKNDNAKMLEPAND